MSRLTPRSTRLGAIATLTALAVVALAVAIRRHDAPTPASDPGGGAAFVASMPSSGSTPDPTADPRASAQLPPAGTRFYASIAELEADPPPSGETVWLDAYHGEIIMVYPGWGRGESYTGCPSAKVSPLLDRPYLLQLAVFNGIRASEPTAEDGPVRFAAGFDAEGALTAFPDLPRFGRLVVRFGDPALGHCDDADRIALVERVAAAFEPTTDWSDRMEAVRRLPTIASVTGSTVMAEQGDSPGPEVGRYELFIPEGLEHRPAPDGATFVLPDLPDHPIRFRRQPIDAAAEPPAAGDEAAVHGPRYLQRPPYPHLDWYVPRPRLAFAVSDGERRGVSARTEAGGFIYTFEALLPADRYAAQELLWRFQELVDRLEVLDDSGWAAAMATPHPAGIAARGHALVNLPSTVAGGVEGQAIVGGERMLALATIEPDGRVHGMARVDLPSPSELGLIRDFEVDVTANQLTGGDRDAARRMLEDADGAWTARAVALRPPLGFAVVAWPTGSGLHWLYVVDAGRADAVPDEEAAAAGLDRILGAVPLHDVEGPSNGIAGVLDAAATADRLLVATSAGLLDVDVSTPGAPIVRASGIDDVVTAVAVAPDGRRAWVCGGRIDAGRLFALDLADPAGARVTATLPVDHALLDCTTDGRALYALTGSETQAIWRFDVGDLDAPRHVDEVQRTSGTPIGLHLLGGRLVVAVTGREVPFDGPYPGPTSHLDGLLVYDVSGFDAPTERGFVTRPGLLPAFASAGRFALATTIMGELLVYGLADATP